MKEPGQLGLTGGGGLVESKKVEQKQNTSFQKIFIHSRKEMLILIVLGLMIALFSFTMGVHLGKRIAPKAHKEEAVEIHPAQTMPDALPNRQDLTEQGKGLPQATEEALQQSLKDEVDKAKIHMGTPRQVGLPEKTRAEKQAAVTHQEQAKDQALNNMDASKRRAPPGRYTLQVGSFPALDEATDQVAALESKGFLPLLRSAEVQGKNWYRIYIGGFWTKAEAEKVGEKHLKSRAIDSFIVAKMVE